MRLRLFLLVEGAVSGQIDNLELLLVNFYRFIPGDRSPL
jgi:hypothetical protein